MAFTTDIKQADADGYATGLAWRDNTTPGGPWYNRGLGLA